MLDKPTTTPPHSDLGKAGLMEILDRQRAAHLAAGPLSAEARIEWLDRLIGLVVDNHDEIADVLSVDFGGRSREATLLADVVSVLGSLKQAKANLEDWMQPVACVGMFRGRPHSDGEDAQRRADLSGAGLCSAARRPSRCLHRSRRPSGRCHVPDLAQQP